MVNKINFLKIINLYFEYLMKGLIHIFMNVPSKNILPHCAINSIRADARRHAMMRVTYRKNKKRKLHIILVRLGQGYVVDMYRQ